MQQQMSQTQFNQMQVPNQSGPPPQFFAQQGMPPQSKFIDGVAACAKSNSIPSVVFHSESFRETANQSVEGRTVVDAAAATPDIVHGWRKSTAAAANGSTAAGKIHGIALSRTRDTPK